MTTPSKDTTENRIALLTHWEGMNRDIAIPSKGIRISEKTEEATEQISAKALKQTNEQSNASTSPEEPKQPARETAWKS